MILLGYIINVFGVDNVCCKNVDGIVLVVFYVVVLGCKCIVFLGGFVMFVFLKECEVGFD